MLTLLLFLDQGQPACHKACLISRAGASSLFRKAANTKIKYNHI